VKLNDLQARILGSEDAVDVTIKRNKNSGEAECVSLSPSARGALDRRLNVIVLSTLALVPLEKLGPPRGSGGLVVTVLCGLALAGMVHRRRATSQPVAGPFGGP
jgi:hypothetical protein